MIFRVAVILRRIVCDDSDDASTKENVAILFFNNSRCKCRLMDISTGLELTKTE